ncbi:DUF1064 domain-containing protein [Helcococcus kunzii]|uniref:DUF1064 domain-containing protein n=1 Tax=Helcococcus kunzii TaxID=40091 RepID=UPI0038B00ECA
MENFSEIKKKVILLFNEKIPIKLIAKTFKLSEIDVKRIILETKSPKYKNKKVKHDGITFDSILEKDRYIELKRLEKLGLISDLKLQPKFEIIPTVRYRNKTYRVTYYIADFMYLDSKKNKIVEDTKGFETDVYKLKRKLFLLQNPDIDFREVRK